MNYFSIRWRFAVFVPVWCVFILKLTNAEMYTAVAELQSLLTTEATLIEALKAHLAVREEKLRMLKRHITEYDTEHRKSEMEAVEYLANPINIYLLIKRLTVDWKFIKENYINKDLHEEILNTIAISEDLKFPTEEDLNGAAVALTRLQDTYNLSTEALANGELNGVKYSAELSADDCFELGRQLYKKEDFHHAISWLKEALKKLHESQSISNRTAQWEILEYLSHSLYMEGDIESAYSFAYELLTVLPSHPRAAMNLHFYKSERRQLLDDNRAEVNEPSSTIKDDFKTDGVAKTADYVKYEQLCRKAIQLPADMGSLLKCRYVHKNNPYLYIAPFKEEEVFLEPQILLYHEVLYSSEIEILKKLAQPQLIRAKVSGKNLENVVQDIRTSKIAWLKYELHPTVENIRKRVADMTHLSMETAELLQVCNYGLGGHYVPHRDYFVSNDKNHSKLVNGNRIATVLFYMSDVAQGGATVFPLLDVALWPEKGSAAFWYNLHSSGELDSDTLHGACPVLQGSKWVSNIWIRERGQEFHRPCEFLAYRS